MRSNTTVAIVMFALTLAIAGCKQQEATSADSAQGAQAENLASVAEAAKAVAQPQAAAPPPPAEPAPQQAAADAAANGVARDEAIETDPRPTVDQVSSSAATYKDGKRKFVRTARAEFRVKDVYRSALAIEDIVAEQGGFVVNNDINAQTMNTQRRPSGNGKLIELTEYTIRGNLTVRVPSDNTQAFLRAIAGQMEFLDNRNFAAADAQFDLLRQQLEYQRNQQTQQELGQAAQQGGRLLDRADVISARSNAKLDRDEALIAQKQFEDRVEFSTINLSLYQLSKIRQTELTDVEAVFRDNRPSFFSRLGDAIRDGWYAALDLLIGLMRLWPLWLIVAGMVFGFRRWRVSRRSRPVPQS